jgi:hypothetical protein
MVNVLPDDDCKKNFVHGVFIFVLLSHHLSLSVLFFSVRHKEISLIQFLKT